MSHHIINTHKRSYVLGGFFIVASKHNYLNTKFMKIFYRFNRLSFYLVSHHNKTKYFFFSGENDWCFALQSKHIKLCRIKGNLKITYELCVTHKVFHTINYSLNSFALYSFKIRNFWDKNTLLLCIIHDRVSNRML